MSQSRDESIFMLFSQKIAALMLLKEASTNMEEKNDLIYLYEEINASLLSSESKKKLVAQMILMLGSYEWLSEAILQTLRQDQEFITIFNQEETRKQLVELLDNIKQGYCSNGLYTLERFIRFLNKLNPSEEERYQFIVKLLHTDYQYFAYDSIFKESFDYELLSWLAECRSSVIGNRILIYLRENHSNKLTPQEKQRIYLIVATYYEASIDDIPPEELTADIVTTFYIHFPKKLKLIPEDKLHLIDRSFLFKVAEQSLYNIEIFHQVSSLEEKLINELIIHHLLYHIRGYVHHPLNKPVHLIKTDRAFSREALKNILETETVCVMRGEDIYFSDKEQGERIFIDRKSKEYAILVEQFSMLQTNTLLSANKEIVACLSIAIDHTANLVSHIVNKLSLLYKKPGPITEKKNALELMCSFSSFFIMSYKIFGDKLLAFLQTKLISSAIPTERFFNRFCNGGITDKMMSVLMDKKIFYPDVNVKLKEDEIVAVVDFLLFLDKHSLDIPLQHFEGIPFKEKVRYCSCQLDILFCEKLGLAYIPEMNEKIQAKLSSSEIFELIKLLQQSPHQNNTLFLQKMLHADFNPHHSFATFITDINQDDAWGKRIALYNLEVEKELQLYNIKTELAFNYPEKKAITFYDSSHVDNAKNKSPSSTQYEIVQWDKNDVRTLFLGNYLSCCLATNGHHFQAILERRADRAAFMHVIMDKQINEPMCGNWLFFVKNDLNEIYVFANFFEMRMNRTTNTALRQFLMDHLCQFTSEYAARIGAKKWFIRPLTYGNIPDFQNLISMEIHLTKVGPPYQDHPFDLDDPYYLNGLSNNLSRVYIYPLPTLVATNTSTKKEAPLLSTLFSNAKVEQTEKIEQANVKADRTIQVHQSIGGQ